MFLSQVTQAPVVIEIGLLKISIPKFLTGDWITWGAEFDADRQQKSIEGLTPEAKFRLLNFYNIMPTTIEDLQSIVTSPGGTQRIAKVCLQRATVIAKVDTRKTTEKAKVWLEDFEPRSITVIEVKEILTYTVHKDLVALAKVLSDTMDEAKPTLGQQDQQSNPPDTTLGEEGKDDPDAGEDLTQEIVIDPLPVANKSELAI